VPVVLVDHRVPLAPADHPPVHRDRDHEGDRQRDGESGWRTWSARWAGWG